MILGRTVPSAPIMPAPASTPPAAAHSDPQGKQDDSVQFNKGISRHYGAFFQLAQIQNSWIRGGLND